MNLDKIIAAVNANTSSGITAMYSTPSVYVKAKNAEKVAWSVKTDDFFPYSDGPSGYWTGYFTSRPALKRYVRQTGAFLQIARQFEVFSGGDGSSTETLWEAQSVAQHHDGVSGTAKQAVTFDYAQRIAKGAAIADATLQATLAKMVTTTGDAPKFVSCPLANVSICDVSVAGGNLVVLVYNPSMSALPVTPAFESTASSCSASLNLFAYPIWCVLCRHERSEQVRVVVNDDSLGVSNSNNEFIASQIVPVAPNPAITPQAGAYHLVFPVVLGPLAFNTYFVTAKAPNPTPRHSHRPSPQRAEGLAEVSHAEEAAANTFIENDLLRVDFDDATGLIVNYTDKVSGVSYAFTQDFAWYDSYQNESLPGQLDGAYVFRPMTQTAHSLAGSVTLKVVKGSLVSEVWQTFTPWVSQIVRLTQGSPVLELIWTVGPIPMDDRQGKNVITRFNTSLASNGTCYTDSNGREFQQRIRNYRATWPWRADEAVSSNFYPINAAAWLTDGKTALVVNNDRTQAGGSIHDGSFELMLHRRLVSDDSKGVAEPLNEPGLDGRGLIITGLTTVALVPVERAAVYARTVQNYVYTYLHTSLAPLTSTIADYVKGHTASRSYAAGVLPDEVELTTLQVAPVPVNGSTVLLRLSHSYGVGEGAQNVTVDLAKLFVQPVKAVVELSLTAATVKKGNSGYVWNTKTGQERVEAKRPVQQSGTSVTLGPLEVKTFGLTF